MTKKQFKHSLFRGLGSAIIELKQCRDKSQYRDIVLYACLHNTTYDMQIEGDRSSYLFQAIKLFDDTDLFEDSIIEKYKNIRHGVWLFNQLTSLLFLFADEGSEKARKALYEKYELLLHKIEKMRKHQSICAERDMLEWLSVWLTSLNGFAEFKKIIFDLGRNIDKGKMDFFSFDWFYANAQGKFGTKRIEKYLQKNAGKSAEVKAFYEAVQIFDNRIYENLPIPTLEEVIQNAYKIQEGITFRNRGKAMRFARTASEDDLKILAEVALNEPNLNIKSELLWAFRKAKYKFTDEILQNLVQSENEDIRDTAFFILDQYPSERMHDLAISIINSENKLEKGIELLCGNFKKEDERVLFDAIKRVKVNNKNSWHGAFSAIETAFAKGRWKPQTDILEYVYQNTLCSWCRWRIVELMNQHKVLTTKILTECLFDSNSDIRAFAERKLKLCLPIPKIVFSEIQSDKR
ncbi:MAG: hypothetical protein K0R18_2009 [Bacillales bacterium]|jgi:hypothetical protein|nr:hypothetical protein [Bacillales bacterium]